MVPKGWGYKRLGCVAELQRGFDLPSSKRIDGNIPIISSGGYSGFHNEVKVKAPGIVTGRYGSIGDVFFIEKDFWPLNTALWVKDFHGNDVKFLYYLLSCFDYKKFSDKTGVPGVNRNDLHAVKVGVPPLPEQRKIAQILSTWDKAINTTERLLTNRQQQKKALMQRLLTGKQRFAGFTHEWKQVQVSDVCKIGRGRVISKEEIALNKGFYPVYSSQTLNNGVMGCIDSYDFDGEYATWTTDGVNAGTVFYRNGKFNCTNVCGTLKSTTDSLDIKFLSLALSRVAFKYVSHTLANPKLMNGVMGTVEFLMPALEEQQKIASVLSAADAEITTIQNQLDNLKQQKKALMQQLLTGKRRVQV